MTVDTVTITQNVDGQQVTEVKETVVEDIPAEEAAPPEDPPAEAAPADEPKEEAKASG